MRKHYEGLGWATNYGLPGTPHRTGHGIGMDGHEPPNLMRADRTPLQAGMCFSDEPGIYIPGEFGPAAAYGAERQRGSENGSRKAHRRKVAEQCIVLRR